MLITLTEEEESAAAAGALTAILRPVARGNSYVDGSRPLVAMWRELDFARAWVDTSKFSPAGNPGPYLKANRGGGWDSTHRIYCAFSAVQELHQRGGHVRLRVLGWDPQNIGGVWHWRVKVEDAAAAEGRTEVECER